MFTIKKTFRIAYGHRLHPYTGKCANLHGHNAVIEVTLQTGKLNAQGMVMDFNEVGARAKKWLETTLDHKVLLKKDPLLKTLRADGQECFPPDGSPTAELLAELIFDALKKQGLPVIKVSFQETETSRASYKE